VFAPTVPLWEIVLRTAVVYAVVLGLLISIIPRTGGQVHRTPRRLRQIRGRR
jgi:hypothetical protein